MTVHPIPRPGGPEQPDRPASGVEGAKGDQPNGLVGTRRTALEAPMSVLELVDRILADTIRTTNAATIITTASKSAVKAILSVGAVLAAVIVFVGLLIHFAGLGPALGGAVVAGASSAVAASRHLRNRRTTRRRHKP